MARDAGHGAGIALAIDGSPAAILHLLFWIALYALVLAITRRSFTPLLLLCGAVAIAGVLDAGYLWPMIEAQTQFPRRTEASFTSILSLLWFLLLPVRGKVLPANGNGHELSVFVGPVIAWLLWRYRRELGAHLPPAMKSPLLVVSLVSIFLGMGSLEALHVPTWLSPFDLLRSLPGFRSMGITGRYWGFLALPLSLLGAAAIWRFVAELRDARKLRLWLCLELLLQFSFQAGTFLGPWYESSPYRPIALSAAFQRGAEQIDYVSRGRHLQGEFITPTRGVVDCYDFDDFIRADIEPGKPLVRRVLVDQRPVAEAPDAQGEFLTWSRIRLRVRTTTLATVPLSVEAPGRVQLVLNQAYHPLWRAPGCATLRDPRGNLIVDCPLSRLRQGAVELSFNDEVSELGAGVSLFAWPVWLAALLVTASLIYAIRTVRGSDGMRRFDRSAP